MPDLYGEMLARTLNRGAPPGHSAAYITEQEALQLRASGGGVAPGGGQYMANGIPSFQESGGVDPGISDPTGPTGGLGSAGHEMGMSSSWNSPAERGMAAATGLSLASAAAAGMAAGSSVNELAEALSYDRQRAHGSEGRDVQAARAEIQAAMARAREADISRRGIEVTARALEGVPPPEAYSPYSPPTAEALDAAYANVRSTEPLSPPVSLSSATTPQQTAAEYGVPTELGAPFGWDERGNYVGYTDDAFTGRDRTSGLPGTPNANPATDSFGRQPGNIDAYGFVTAQGVRNAPNNISEDGLGWQSPGAMSIEEGMSFEDLAAINSLGRDGGYSVNSTNPDAHDLEVSFLNARYNPQFANAVYGIGGLVSPSFMMGVNAINSRSPHAQYNPDYQSPGFGNMLGVGNMLGQAARGIGLGGVVDAIGDVRSGIGDAIGNVGTQLGNALSPVGDFFSGQPPAVEGPSAPQDGGSQEIAFVPNIAPLNEVAAPGEGPFVSGDTETQSANIPPEILARILANEQSGRERVGLA